MEPILATRLSQVEKRDHTVESKLTALLTLTSVLSATVTVSLVAAATLGNAEDIPGIFAFVAVILVFYVVMQLLCLLLATVRGLKRSSYKQLSLDDITPQDGEAREAYRVRLLNLQATYMRSNEFVVDQKVSHMAVAHVALKNALLATLILIVFALVIASFHLAIGSNASAGSADTRNQSASVFSARYGSEGCTNCQFVRRHLNLRPCDTDAAVSVVGIKYA